LLSHKGIDFVAIDVANDAAGREKLFALGARSVPVVAYGTQFIYAQNLEDVAKFVGIHDAGLKRLPPGQLVEKWLIVLGATRRYILQMPEERLPERVINNRDRSIHSLGQHVFRIAEAFLECVVTGVEYTSAHASAEVPTGVHSNRAEIATYGGLVMEKLQGWWNSHADRSCQQTVDTYFGIQPIHMLLERSTWHSAQHARQLIAVLERFGIAPDGPLTASDLAGLPLPEGLWE